MGQLATIQQAQDYLCVRNQNHFAQVFGDDKKAASFLAVALANVQREPKLLMCEEKSVRDSLLEAAQIDLCPGGALQHAFLIPYKGQCTLQVGYRGLAELVQREGAVKKVWANVVYQDEVDDGSFRVLSGSEHQLIHDRDVFREDPPSWEKLIEAGLVGAYACAELANGAVNFEVVGLDPLKRAKAMSRSPAWDKWATEMIKKFPLKRLCKRLPKTLSIEKWAALDLKHGERDAIELAPKGDVYENAVELADDALGDTTVDVDMGPVMPGPEVARVGVNAQIRLAWDSLDVDQRAELEMDRELTDYFSAQVTSDAEARHFLARMLAVVYDELKP